MSSCIARMKGPLIRRSLTHVLLLVAYGLLRVECQDASSEAASTLQLPLNLIKLPPGFRISLYYDDYVPGARSMALSKGRNGNATIVYVGTRDKWSTASSPPGIFAGQQHSESQLLTSAFRLMSSFVIVARVCCDGS